MKKEMKGRNGVRHEEIKEIITRSLFNDFFQYLQTLLHTSTLKKRSVKNDMNKFFEHTYSQATKFTLTWLYTLRGKHANMT
jgi:hypothetical protein